MKNTVLLIALILFSGALLAQNNNVGIGTSSPQASALLDLTSTTKGLLIPRMTAAQRIGIVGPVDGLIVYQTDNSISDGPLGFYIRNSGSWKRMARAEELGWIVSGTNVYTATTGNVGIGVTSGIDEKLTVRGDLFLKNTSIIDYSEIEFQSQSSSGGLLTFLEPDSVTAGAMIRYRAQYNALILSNEFASDGEVVLFENGNVGISTGYVTDAVSKLQIVDGDPVVDFDNNGYMQLGHSIYENLVFGDNEILARDNGVASPLFLQQEGGAVRIGSGAVADTRLQITGGNNATLAEHGYLLLGHVTGENIVMDQNSIQARINGATDILSVQNYGGDFRVNNIGLVVHGTTGFTGLGTASPAARLHVAGDGIFNTVDPTLAFHQSGVQKGFVQLDGNNLRVGTFADNDLGNFVVRTNNGDRLFVTPSGNVGIGVASPAAKLDVAGKIRIGATGEALKIDGNGSFIQFYLNGVAKTYIQQLGNDLRIGNSTGNSSGRLYLFGDEVAINTSGPASGYSLSVGGEIICEELRVELQGNAPWPDYVFANDYKLRPLHELKSFVAENKHLPNIPAAAQVEDEGFDVGDMNRRLLEKVEELTLYILQQQEELDALNARMKEWEKGRMKE